MMRLRSSSSSLSRATLSDISWRNCPITSAAARGASEAVSISRRDRVFQRACLSVVQMPGQRRSCRSLQLLIPPHCRRCASCSAERSRPWRNSAGAAPVPALACCCAGRRSSVVQISCCWAWSARLTAAIRAAALRPWPSSDAIQRCLPLLVAAKPGRLQRWRWFSRGWRAPRSTSPVTVAAVATALRKARRAAVARCRSSLRAAASPRARCRPSRLRTRA